MDPTYKYTLAFVSELKLSVPCSVCPSQIFLVILHRSWCDTIHCASDYSEYASYVVGSPSSIMTSAAQVLILISRGSLQLVLILVVVAVVVRIEDRAPLSFKTVLRLPLTTISVIIEQQPDRKHPVYGKS